LAAGESAKAVLPQVAADQLERMRTQAQHLGAATCSRAADLVHEALDQMVGATSPRLQLELLCARLLLPAAEEGVRALAVRLDRLETSGVSSRSADTPAEDVPPEAIPAPQPARSSTPSPEPAAPTPAAPAPSSTPPPPPESGAPARPATAAWQQAAQAHREKAGNEGWPSVQVP